METLRFLIVFCLSTVFAKKQAKDFFPICHASNPDVSQCIKDVLHEIRPKLVIGIPELKLVPLEPLLIPRMEYSEGTGNFKFQQIMTNFTIHGLGQYQVKNVTFDLETLNMDLDIWTPTLRFVSDYEISGKILLLPIKGSGDCEFNFTNVSTAAHVKAKLIKKNKEDYLEVESFNWDIDVKNAKIQLNNLFNGDPTLGKAMNDFLNENWREAFKTYKHLAEQSFGILFKDFSNNVYSLFPYKELFPE